MRLLLPVFLILFFTTLLKGQNFTGQWKGEFIDNSVSFENWGGESCEYVLELETNKNSVTGYSYTYFSENGKKYFTICRLEGTIDLKQKSIEIKEVERTKTNVPASIKNCFQVHKLSYFKKGKEETLIGSWSPVPKQNGDCGFGKTNLSRRLLDNSFGYKGTTKNNIVKNTQSPAKKNQENSKPNLAKISKEDLPMLDPDKAPPIEKVTDSEKKMVPEKVIIMPTTFEKRENNIVRKIEVGNQNVRIDLFDNGEIDGDSVSLFFNGSLVISHRKLTEKAISFNIWVEDDEESLLEMYADNLGTIAPNTAMMIITDGKKRYEVRIASDLTKSGAISFIHKKGS